MKNGKTESLYHVAIAVKSIDEVAKLYESALGLKVTHTETVGEQGVKAAMLEPKSGGTAIELLEPLSDNSPISKFLEKRKKNAIILNQLLSDLNVILPEERYGVNVNWYLYTIATANRNKLMKQLHSKGIGATAYYPIPVHKTPFYKKALKLPITDWAANSVLSIPVNPLVHHLS